MYIKTDLQRVRLLEIQRFFLVVRSGSGIAFQFFKLPLFLKDCFRFVTAIQLWLTDMLDRLNLVKRPEYDLSIVIF
jgi:hypothetical protein